MKRFIFRRILPTIVQMAAGGMSQRDIAEKLGFNDSSLSQWKTQNPREWKEALTAARLAPKPISPEQLESMAAEIKQTKPRESGQPQPGTLKEICEQEYFKLNLRITSEGTTYQYHVALRDYAKFLGHEPTLNDLDDDKITLWMRDSLKENLAAITVRERAGRIGALWTWLAKRRIVDKFPTFIKPRPPETMPLALTAKQLVSLFQSAARERGNVCGIPAGLWWTSFLAFVWNTGERKGAAMAVKVEWIDFERQQCTIPPGVRKGGRKWGVYSLWPETIPVLRAAIMVDPARELVWPIDYCHESYYTRYNRILRDAGIPVSRKYKTHALRCTHATMKQVLGGDATRAMGHSDPATSLPLSRH